MRKPTPIFYTVVTFALWIGVTVFVVTRPEEPLGGDVEATEKVVPTDTKLEAVKTEIIDSFEEKETICDKDAKCQLSTSTVIKYYHAGEEEKVLNVIDKGEYSNYVDEGTNAKGEKTVRIYGLPFIKDVEGKYRSVEFATTSKEQWDKQIMEVNESPLSFLYDPFFQEVHADTVYAVSGDGFAGCSWSTKSYKVYQNQACDNFDATDYTSNYSFAWSGAWDNRNGFYAFDTAPLDGTVVSAYLHIFYRNEWTVSPSTVIYVTDGNQVRTNLLKITDQWLYSTSGGVAININTGTQNYEYTSGDISGLVDTSTSSKIALIHTDMYNWPTSKTYNSIIAFNSSRQTGTTYDPYLEVTVGAGGGSAAPNTFIYNSLLGI